MVATKQRFVLIAELEVKSYYEWDNRNKRIRRNCTHIKESRRVTKINNDMHTCSWKLLKNAAFSYKSFILRSDKIFTSPCLMRTKLLNLKFTL